MSCLQEIVSLHGVWQTREAYRPIYGDLETLGYLAALNEMAVRGAEIVILPIYAPDPIHFRRQNYVFLSTGLILAARDEQTLLAAIRSEVQGIRARGTHESSHWRSPCSAPVSAGSGGFEKTQARLAQQISEYEDALVPRLKRRL